MAKKNIVLTSDEIAARGQCLLQRLRNQGVWQYVPWFVDKDRNYLGDASAQDRMRRIFNQKGTPMDTNLLLDMERIADKHLAA